MQLLTDMITRAGIAPNPRLPPVPITGMTSDSRKVANGFLFAALPGTHADGRSFIGEAVAKGAAAVLAPAGTEWPPGIPPRPMILDAEPRRALARLAASYAGAQPDIVVAVTGTNGKTSTVDFLRQLWDLSGLRAASLGTLGLVAPGYAGGAGLTTPDPVALATMLAELARSGVRHAAMEASSHGLDQFRLDGVRLRAAGFSNLTRDHLDYHGNISAYRQAKLRLFNELLPAGGVAVVNADMDAETLAALRIVAKARRLDVRSVGEAGAHVRLTGTTARPDGQVLHVTTGSGPRDIEIGLPGRFQADNVLMAACLAEATGVADVWPRLPALVGVRGRMELAARLPHGAAAYVDYAHTPDALARLLSDLRPHVAGRLICVFGAGGDRDPGKRPLMGQAVAFGADCAIVTDDNPRTENPAAIRAAILQACPDAVEIGDRASAIAAGLNMLGAGDVLVVAGKGHELGQTVGTETYPFDDAATLRRFAGVA
jgi:UDP-N-acetylmuramoyl-L-alanyl-D-glutamate--2,6-diaminopimelate ligase